MDPLKELIHQTERQQRDEVEQLRGKIAWLVRDLQDAATRLDEYSHADHLGTARLGINELGLLGPTSLSFEIDRLVHLVTQRCNVIKALHSIPQAVQS